MKEQMGWRAVLRSVKEQAPYWAEKMPEMPTLLHEYLRTQKHQIEHQQAATLAIVRSQRQFAWRLWWGMTGAALLVSTAVLWSSNQPVWLTSLSGVLTVFSIAISWRKASHN